MNSLSLYFDPLLSLPWLTFIIGLMLAFAAISLFKSRRHAPLRILTALAFILILLGPSVLEQDRSPVKDVALIVVDKSQSQSFGERDKRTQATLAHLKDSLSDNESLELRIINAPLESNNITETTLFDAINQTLADVPSKRRAGVMIISDGQIHDIPQDVENIDDYGPIHLLLSGEKNEKDRQLVILETPSYGLVGENITIKYRIEDTANIDEDYTSLTISKPGTAVETLNVPTNEDLSLELPITHPGQNIFEMNVQGIEDEITAINNRVALNINGVRDQLRVLLVSGKPHTGGRAWRDLLTSDPSVNLVHFTILRDPSKLDATPRDELSLIAFPFRELFEVKLNEFDLIIFDRYQLSRILPDIYFDNIARYVKNGGALLEASGPSFAGRDSLYYTSLQGVLPGQPTGDIINQAFTPTITERGQFHPVTHPLKAQSNWGEWLRQVVIEAQSGDVLMNGANAHPLLLLSRMDKGRVAQIASDHLWLWSRGHDGGGPHSELLRRVVHWLMQEPELDEKSLRITTIGTSKILVEQWNTNANSAEIIVTKPDGTEDALTLKSDQKGLLRAYLDTDQLGVYSFKDGDGQTSFAIIGDLNPPELRSVKTTAAPMGPLLKKTGGGAIWLSKSAAPSIRFMEEQRHYSGQSWIGLRRNNDYVVNAVRAVPLIPYWVALIILMGLALTTWWREGR